MTVSKRNKFLLFLWFVLILPVTAPLADEANYFYDDTGRLFRVLKGTEGLTYQYDQVGNLLSISKGTVGTGDPVISSISPNVFFIGSTTLLTIQGQNLFSTKSITCDNCPSNCSLNIKILDVTDTEIKAEVTVPSECPVGAVNIKVTTAFGSRTIQTTLTLSKLSFSPGQLAIAPGESGMITANIFPSLDHDINITINNNNTSVVSVPQSVTIPVGGSATFAVDALQEGSAVIDSGSATTVVFVNTFSLPPGETVTQKAGPVSVYIQTPTSPNTTTSSSPVSVYIETPLSANTTTSSLPVSIYLETPMGDSTTVSLPVSTCIQEENSNPPVCMH